MKRSYSIEAFEREGEMMSGEVKQFCDCISGLMDCIRVLAFSDEKEWPPERKHWLEKAAGRYAIECIDKQNYPVRVKNFMYGSPSSTNDGYDKIKNRMAIENEAAVMMFRKGYDSEPLWYGYRHEYREGKKVYGDCPWCGAFVCLDKTYPQDKDSTPALRCEKKCGFSISSENSGIVRNIGRILTVNELLDLFKNGSVKADGCTFTLGERTKSEYPNRKDFVPIHCESI